MNETSKDFAQRKHRDTIELLVGATGIVLFGIALVVWPRLGYFIADAVGLVRDLFRP